MCTAAMLTRRHTHTCLVKTAKRTPSNSRYAASALKNLSSDNSENKLTIAREGGIEALVAALLNHGDEAEVLQYVFTRDDE